MLEQFRLFNATRLADLLTDARNTGSSGDHADQLIWGLARFGHAGKNVLCFCDRDPGSDSKLEASGAIILSTDDLIGHLMARFPQSVCLALPDPRATFIDVGNRVVAENQVDISDSLPRPFGIHHTAKVGANSEIHPASVIEEGVTIGSNCVIHRGTWIQAGAIVRDHVVMGCDGIDAYVGRDGIRRSFPHLASVIVGRNTEIGAGTVIPRGVLTSTRIGSDVVIGNLCNIGHGVVIGNGVWMSVGCMIGGHTRISDKATIAMGVTIRDNLKVGADAQVGMGSVVVKDVDEAVSVFGNPARTLQGQAKAGPDR